MPYLSQDPTALARLLSRFGLAGEGYWQWLGWAMLLDPSSLLVLDTRAIRLSGIPGMLLLNGARAFKVLMRQHHCTPRISHLSKFPSYSPLSAIADTSHFGGES